MEKNTKKKLQKKKEKTKCTGKKTGEKGNKLKMRQTKNHKFEIDEENGHET